MMNDSEGKRCPDCGQWKPFSEFYQNRSKRDGCSSYCKTCWLVRNEDSRQRHLDARQEQARRHQRETYSEKREERLARRAAWYADKGREWHKQHRLANPERYREASRRWKSKPGNNAAAVNRRRARRLGNGVTHTDAEWQLLVEEYKGLCACCGRIPIGLWPDVLTRDHVVPLSQGGADDISNIQPLCLSCNSAKGERATDYRK